MESLKLFANLTDKAFATANRYFNAQARAHLVTRWQDYCANGTLRVYASGDIKAANKMYSAAVICGFRLAFQRAVVPQIPFSYSKDAGFTGKIQKGKRDALIVLNADGFPKWEADMRDRFDNENTDKAAAEFNLVKRLDAVIKKDRQQDTPHTDAEVRKELTALLKQYPAVKAVPDSTVAHGKDQATLAKTKAQRKAA